MKISDIKIYKILLVSCLIILIVESLFVVYLSRHAEDKKQTVMDDSFAKVLLDNMSFLKPFEIQSERYILSPETVIKYGDGQLASFNDIFGDDEFVPVYRFSEMHCDLCAVQHFMIFKELSAKIDLKKLVLLSSYSDTKKIKILKHTHELDFRIFNIMDDIGILINVIPQQYYSDHLE